MVFQKDLVNGLLADAADPQMSPIQMWELASQPLQFLAWPLHAVVIYA